MNAFIICSLKSLADDYDKLIWVRSNLLIKKYSIAEDWINYRLDIVDSKPKFKHTSGFDYMKVAIDQITNSDLIIIFLTVPSTYVTTLLKYSTYLNKKIILLYRSKKLIDKINLNLSENITPIQVKSIKQLIKYL